MQIFYMLMYPHTELAGWVLSDIAATKKEEFPMSTWFSFLIKTDGGTTETFHPDLEDAINRVKLSLQEIL